MEDGDGEAAIELPMADRMAGGECWCSREEDALEGCTSLCPEEKLMRKAVEDFLGSIRDGDDW